jgi:hypothetical protein
MKRLLLVALLAISFMASAVVIRSDVKDAKYRVPASAFPALVDMPGEGHGVLIAPQWVATAAHAAPMQGMEGEVSIGGVARKVKRVITYPGYKRLPDVLIKEALASGDFSKAHAFLASSNDIALIEGRHGQRHRRPKSSPLASRHLAPCLQRDCRCRRPLCLVSIRPAVVRSAA